MPENLKFELSSIPHHWSPVDMTVLNHGVNGAVGDCFRCCIASILAVDAEDVPHVMNYDWAAYEGQDQPWFPRLNEYLRMFGLVYMDLKIGPTTPVEWFAALDQDITFSLIHLIHGMSPRGYPHTVVGRNGNLLHDPHPSREGLVGPQEDGWALGLLMTGGSRAFLR